MKKSLIIFLTLLLLSGGLCSNASERPVSRWMERSTASVVHKEQSANAKVTAKKKANQEHISKNKTKAQVQQQKATDKKAERKKKQEERRVKVEEKKKQLRALFTKS